MNIINSYHLTQYLHNLLNVDSFRDYCPNGLQIEGQQNIDTLVTGVTINQDLINEAIKNKAQGILVHHGLFWKGDNPCITGIKKQRLSLLLQHNINLWAYHLPLDAHIQYGNNACLGRLFELDIIENFGEQNLGCIAQVKQNEVINYKILHNKLQNIFKRSVQVIGDVDNFKAQNIKRIAWCSGGAQSYFHDAIKAGADVFISGEISEQYVHMAREENVLYMAAGHHATERYGVQALGEHLHQQYNIKHIFIDIDSPI